MKPVISVELMTPVVFHKFRGEVHSAMVSAIFIRVPRINRVKQFGVILVFVKWIIHNPIPPS
jgi:hypothetical protein